MSNVLTTSAKRFKGLIYEQLARLGKALASPIRLELLDVLSQGPHTVEALSKAIDQSFANTSQHLQVLRAARLIESERSGAHIIYRIADKDILVLSNTLRRVGERRLAEVAQLTGAFLEERGALERTDSDTLRRKVRRGEVTLLDVRPVEEYAAGHIPSAISVPLKELEKRLADLPRGREVVAYCRGPLCVLSIEAVKILRKHGLDAVRWEEGVGDWVARGLRLETGDRG